MTRTALASARIAAIAALATAFAPPVSAQAGWSKQYMEPSLPVAEPSEADAGIVQKQAMTRKQWHAAPRSGVAPKPFTARASAAEPSAAPYSDPYAEPAVTPAPAAEMAAAAPLPDPVAPARSYAPQTPHSAPTALRTLPPGETGYYIKAGAFRSFANAQRLHARLFSIGSAQITHREAGGLDYYGVYLGPWRTAAEAFKAFGEALDAGMQDGKIIPPG